MAKPISKEMLYEKGIQVVLPPNISTNAVLIDNTTVDIGGEVLLGRSQGKTLEEEGDCEDRYYAEANNLLEALILYDQVYVESFGLSRMTDAQRVVALFPDILKAAYIPTLQRYMLAKQVIRDGRNLLEKTVYPHWDSLHEKFFHSRQHAITDLNLFKPYQKPKPDSNLFAIMRDEPDGSSAAEEAFSQAVELLIGGSTNHAYRSLYYIALTKFLGIGYVPHPWRALLINCMFGRKNSDLVEESPLASRLLRDVASRIQRTIMSAFEVLKPELTDTFSLPPVLEVVRRTMEKRDCSIEQAIRRVRDASISVAYREWVNKISSVGKKDRSKIVREYQTVLEAVKKWKRDAGDLISYKKRPITLGVVGWGLTARSTFEIKDPVLIPVTRKHKVFSFLHAIAFRRPF